MGRHMHAPQYWLASSNQSRQHARWHQRPASSIQAHTTTAAHIALARAYLEAAFHFPCYHVTSSAVAVGFSGRAYRFPPRAAAAQVKQSSRDSTARPLACHVDVFRHCICHDLHTSKVCPRWAPSWGCLTTGGPLHACAHSVAAKLHMCQFVVVGIVLLAAPQRRLRAVTAMAAQECDAFNAMPCTPFTILCVCSAGGGRQPAAPARTRHAQAQVWIDEA